ncbi:substrate-binding domain-containing protein [Chromobacterium alticapitis]|uniref:D-ribose ABC transporter substrate-binding protein n=1 Tax=Chromobacterium alticapitis TaxID=2073169 RepID=A0A2S5DJU8_9NEIS|nr:substrate-binding domain-containing protein [Chromobacterium alticapitis]POZ63360.1 D-ribose ABC transporter substrate-binding protein [Chromobacterium alticapitis]
MKRSLNMRGTFSALLILMLSLGMAACGERADADKEEARVGLALSNLSNPYFIALRDGALAEARRQGVKLIVRDAHDDPARQREDIAELARERAAVILLNPTDSSLVADAASAAAVQGIKVVSLDRSIRGAAFSSHIESDNVAGGMLAGQYLMARLGGQGKVVELMGIAGSSAARERDAGFRQVLAGHPAAAVLQSRPADFDRRRGQAEMARLLRAHRDIRAVFAQNDEMALGAAAALKEGGRAGVPVVGFDAIAEARDAVRSGALAATVRQQPELIGRYGVRTARLLADGKPVDRFIPVPLQLIRGELR